MKNTKTVHFEPVIKCHLLCSVMGVSTSIMCVSCTREIHGCTERFPFSPKAVQLP